MLIFIIHITWKKIKSDKKMTLILSEDVSNGIYILKLTGENGTYFRKIVKEWNLYKD